MRLAEASCAPRLLRPEGPSDQRFLYLSEILPTAWQAVEYADVEPGGTLAVYGGEADPMP